MKWNYEYKASGAGWYAVLICYDIAEGVFPSADYWDGAKWLGRAVIAVGDRCNSQKEAQDLAYDNDPDAASEQTP